MIITIDGPAGAGKSTAARNLARRLGIAYLDTGATYRAVAWKLLSEGADLTDENAIARAAAEIDINLAPNDNQTVVYVDGRDVTEHIRSSQVTSNVRHVAGCAAARTILVELQRRIGARLGSFVSEGRDQGSVVFPGADLKIYLEANPAERAERRQVELSARGEESTVEDVRRAIIERDRHDMSREVGPLVAPADSVRVDTSGKSIDQVSEELLGIAKERL